MKRGFTFKMPSNDIADVALNGSAGCGAADGSGFTLVELSIVLVIIGLLIGGILVAQSMMSTAKVLGLAREVSQYNIAANLFKSNFSYWPGDVPNSVGGFVSPCGNNANGNADGIINKSSIAWEYQGALCELSVTKYISAAQDSVGFVSPYNKNSHVAVPIYNSVCAMGGSDSCFIFTIDNNGNQPSGTIVPVDALALDKKIDDGIPYTGNIIGIRTINGQYSDNADNCGPFWPGMPYVPSYNLATNSPSCLVSFKIIENSY